MEDILHTAMRGQCMDAQGNVAFTQDPAAVEENRLLLVPSPALNSVFVLDVTARRNGGPLICFGAFDRPKFVAARSGTIVVLTREDVVVVAGAAIVCKLPHMTTSKAGRPRRPLLPTTACFAADPCRQEVYVAYAQHAEGEAHHAVFVLSPSGEWHARPGLPLAAHFCSRAGAGAAKAVVGGSGWVRGFHGVFARRGELAGRVRRCARRDVSARGYRVAAGPPCGGFAPMEEWGCGRASHHHCARPSRQSSVLRRRAVNFLSPTHFFFRPSPQFNGCCVCARSRRRHRVLPASRAKGRALLQQAWRRAEWFEGLGCAFGAKCPR